MKVVKRCNAVPYEGSEKYIFITYCHKDTAAVFPVIERLARDGYRVWYDEGVDPGDDWPEIIAEHLNNCSACISFISEMSLNSHNCRREINFALLKKKPFISVILEKVQMSPGMEMQLSSTQSVFRYELPSNEAFFEKLYSSDIIKPSKGKPAPDVIVSSPEEHSGADNGLFSEEARESFSDNWFIKSVIQPENNESRSCEVTTALLYSCELLPERETAWLIRLSTNEKIVITSPSFRLGRSETRCDFSIRGNGAVGRHHATIFYMDGAYYISDNFSMNKTYLNSRELLPEERYKLRDNDTIRLADESFVFHVEYKASE